MSVTLADRQVHPGAQVTVTGSGNTWVLEDSANTWVYRSGGSTFEVSGHIIEGLAEHGMVSVQHEGTPPPEPEPEPEKDEAPFAIADGVPVERLADREIAVEAYKRDLRDRLHQRLDAWLDDLL